MNFSSHWNRYVYWNFKRCVCAEDNLQRRSSWKRNTGWWVHPNGARIEILITSSGQKTAAHKSDLNTTGLQHSQMGQQNSLMFWMLLRKRLVKSAQSGSLALNYFQMYKVKEGIALFLNVRVKTKIVQQYKGKDGSSTIC